MKLRLTRDELKRQRDALNRYQRYLPILELKKKQLQIEILHAEENITKKKKEEEEKRKEILTWIGLLNTTEIEIKPWILPQEIIYGTKDIAGIVIPYLKSLVFPPLDYDLFLIPLWMDYALERLRQWVALREEIAVLEKGMVILKEELRITTQRVNLFEKIKIPQAEEAIRIIKIYLGDQMANAIARSKLAKRKLEEEEARL
ncbi:MAG: V-type ATP synthase subunit D [Candidatus Omnitrophica bacterium]|nr:V-type ATP synthase subunit D [Candidatus Omnitrophota bacterium]MCM8792877.1 V-type ATP synthase subunit D [Candidatus Omnitrophota bacterium]